MARVEPHHLQAFPRCPLFVLLLALLALLASVNTGQAQLLIGPTASLGTDTNLGIGGLVLGGVGVAAGVVLFILSNDSGEATANAPRVTPWVGLNSAGLSGTF